MRKIIFFLTPLLVLTILFLVIVLVINRDAGRGALQVTSIPQSEVFMDGKPIGKTPLCLCDLDKLIKVGNYTLKIVPTNSAMKPIEQKITIYQGVLTVVDRTFEEEAAASTGSIITLSPIDDSISSELLVISFPTKADVILDSNPAGTTPLLLKNVTASDHEIKLIKDGYKEKILKVKTIAGKKLEAGITLGIRSDINSREEEKVASVSAQTEATVSVLQTPTGYLRVRESDSVSSPELAQVRQGTKLILLQEKEDWFEVKLPDGQTGWVSAEFVKKN